MNPPEAFPVSLLSRIEDAGLNASAPPQQRWMDGWLLRFSPGKAWRARCVNAVAAGRMPWPEKLELARTFYADQGLPLAVRITPFTLPAELDAGLAAAGYALVHPTQVMVRIGLGGRSGQRHAPVGLWHEPAAAVDFAEAIGLLRGSPAAQRAAHADRLQHAPVPAERLVVRREADGATVACGQSVGEGDCVGLYDIHVRDDLRRSGLAAWLCEHLLAQAANAGRAVAYLQVDAANGPARSLYAQLGFVDAYRYHYRCPAQRP